MSASARVAAIVAACVATLAAGCGSSSKPVATTPGQSAFSVATAAPPAAGSTQAATPTSPATPSGGATTSTSGTGGTSGAGPQTQSCGTVPFAAASSHGAFEIRATGASCPAAQAVAAAARSCFGCGYAAQGFHCAGREVTTGLLRVNYTCTQGSSKVTFVRA